MEISPSNVEVVLKLYAEVVRGGYILLPDGSQHSSFPAKIKVIGREWIFIEEDDEDERTKAVGVYVLAKGQPGLFEAEAIEKA